MGRAAGLPTTGTRSCFRRARCLVSSPWVHPPSQAQAQARLGNRSRIQRLRVLKATREVVPACAVGLPRSPHVRLKVFSQERLKVAPRRAHELNRLASHKAVVPRRAC